VLFLASSTGDRSMIVVHLLVPNILCAVGEPMACDMRCFRDLMIR